MRLLELFDWQAAQPVIKKAAGYLIDHFREGSAESEYDIYFWDTYYSKLSDLGCDSPYEIDDCLSDNEDLLALYNREKQNWAEVRAESACDDISYELKKNSAGRAILYREITSDKNWPNRILDKPIGIYWSFNPETEQQWGNQDDENVYMLKAEIPFSAVNWLQSIIQNADPTYEYEKEIRLIEGSTINIIDIKYHNSDSDYAWRPVESLQYPIKVMA